MSAFRDKINAQKTGYYKVADLEQVREATHTIAFLAEDQMVFDKECDVLHFSDTGKRLILNVTNSDTLMDLFGDQPADWPGKHVTLYIGGYGKDNKPCVRLKALGTESKSKASAANGPVAVITPPPPLKDDLSDEISF